MTRSLTPREKLHRVLRILAPVLWLLVLAPSARSEPLVITANTSDPVPRAAFEAVVDLFRRENPELSVEVNYYDHESYKTAIRNWLTAAPPDIVMWFAGNRMRQFVTPGLLADISDLYTPARRDMFTPATIDLVSQDGRQYGVPYSYANWGIYYRTDLFASAGAASVVGWGDLLAACEKLKTLGIDPIAIGTKDLWPTGGWFDYIDLRLNGLAFHMDIMAGSVSFRDPRIRAVFGKWRELLDRGCFNQNHAGLSWQLAQALLFQGKAAMMLIGSFIVPNIPADLETKIGLAAFPQIDAGVPRAEEAPMNSIHMPAGAANVAAARRFLVFMMRPDVQSLYTAPMKVLPANRSAAPAESRLLGEGRTLLEGASGFSQFIDRDTNEELAGIAMSGFQEFMLAPDRLDAILDRIEQARLRIYRAK
jgi:multiple sugar transport system substrate-binding protein